MERKALPIGFIVKSERKNSIEYVIDKCIGYGASSVVYDAHYVDQFGCNHYVRLKECYPFNRSIVREKSGYLMWQEPSHAKMDQEKFIESYKKSIEFQNLDDLRNISIFSTELLETNGTLYSVMGANNGELFENNKSEGLREILTAIKLLDDAVGKYHKNGYLHLDIKPSNFMVFPAPSEHIILFDNDSAVSTQDLADNKVKYLAYSQGWAAPEQENGEFELIGPETDIYSVGATLFYKVMGRTPEFLDIYSRAEYVFQGEKFEKVNPKIKRLLKKLFKRTIVTFIDKRYHSADELIIDLNEAIECIRDGVPYVLSDYKYPLEGFVGRYEELGAINEAFKKQRNIFISGIGGIGKSELAKKYAFLMQNTYDAIIYLRYTGNETVNNLLAQIDIYNCEINNEKEAINALQKICKELNVLFILDNFDISDEHYDQLNDFLGLSGDKLITTRTDFRDSIDENTTIINVGALGSNNLISLFEHNAQRAFTASEKQVIDDILKQFEYHTLMVPILARKFRDGGYRSIDEFKAEIDNGISKMKGKTVLTKDGITYRLKVYDLIERVFAMSALESNPDYISALSNLYFLRNIRLTRPLYKDIVQDYDQMDALNELIMLGWVQEVECENKEKEIQIHPLIIELIRNKINPKLTDREELCNYLKDYIVKIYESSLGDNGELSNLERSRFAKKISFLVAILSTVDLNKQEDLYVVIKILNDFVNTNINLVYNIDTILGVSKYFDIKSIENIDDCELKFAIVNWLEKVISSSIIHHIKYIDDNVSYKEQLIKMFDICYNILQGYTGSNKESLVFQMCVPIIRLMYTFEEYVDDTIVNQVRGYYEIISKTFNIRCHTGLASFDIETSHSIDFFIFAERKKVIAFDDNELPVEFFQMEYQKRQFTRQFLCDADISNFEQEVDSCSVLTYEDKITIYLDVIKSLTYILCENQSDDDITKSTAPIKWERFEQAKEILTQKCRCDLKSYSTKPSLEDCCEIANIMLGKTGAYENLVYPLIDAFNGYIKKMDNPKKSYYLFDTIDTVDSKSRLFNNLFVLSRLQKDSLILGDLIKISDSIKTKFNLSSDEMFDWYRTIRDCAERALREEPDNKVFASYYNTYRDLCEKLSNKI